MSQRKHCRLLMLNQWKHGWVFCQQSRTPAYTYVLCHKYYRGHMLNVFHVAACAAAQYEQVVAACDSLITFMFLIQLNTVSSD